MPARPDAGAPPRARLAGRRLAPAPQLVVDRSRHLATPKGTRAISFLAGTESKRVSRRRRNHGPILENDRDRGRAVTVPHQRCGSGAGRPGKGEWGHGRHARRRPRRILAAYERQLGRATLQHAGPAEPEHCEEPEGRLDLLPRGEDRCDGHAALPRRARLLPAGQQGLCARRQHRASGVEVRAQAARRLGRLQRALLHRQASRRGDLRRVHLLPVE